MSEYRQALLHISQYHTAELNNVQESITSFSQDNFIIYYNLQNALPQDELKTEVSFDNVCQNVFNFTGRHGVALRLIQNLPKMATGLTMVDVYIMTAVSWISLLL